MLIMAKTMKRVPHADEVDSQEESPEDLETLIREARQESEEAEIEDTSANESDMEVSHKKLNLSAFPVSYCLKSVSH